MITQTVHHRYHSRQAILVDPPSNLLGLTVNCGVSGIPITIHPGDHLTLHIAPDGAPVLWVLNDYLLGSNYKDFQYA
jgi:hypothetical protein